jgi:uncharacterized protein
VRYVPPVILLPPSEGKAEGGSGPPIAWDSGRFGALGADRRAVRDGVRRMLRRRADAERLLGVRGPHLERALAEWRDLDHAPTAPVVTRYAGVVWAALDVPGMDAAARRRAMGRLVVPSGLWGLVDARDAIPPYRLKMAARVWALGHLAAWWRPRVSPLLRTRAGRGMIIDLLPREHAVAIDAAALRPGALVRVDIVEDGPAGRRSVGHAGKSLKGRLARALIVEDVRTVPDLTDLRVEGLVPAGVAHDDGMVRVTFRRDA